VRNILRRRPRPALTVVVAVYDVREYLTECFDSLAAQTFSDFEVIAVDDGSSDGSGAWLDERARVEPRLRVIHQRNRGLGAARNRGVKRARGEFLTFLDPDDVLPPRAYEKLVGSLRRSGSALAVGAIERFEDGDEDRWQSRWSRVAHARARSAVTLTEAPEALLDIVACNRVVRRDVWRTVVGAFPTGVVYEDHLPVLRLYLDGGPFDILSETTYLWRRRGDESSLGQRKHELQNLLDRVTAKRHGLAAVDAHGDETVSRWYVSRVLSVDLPPFLRGAADPVASEEYWRAARDFARVFVERAQAAPAVWDYPEPHQRVSAWLAAEDRRGDLNLLSEAALEQGRARLPTRAQQGDVLLDLPALGVESSDVPRALLVLDPSDTTLRMTVLDVATDEDALVVTGRARLRRLPGAQLTALDLGLRVAPEAPRAEPGEDALVHGSATIAPVDPAVAPGCDVVVRFPLDEVRAAVSGGRVLWLTGTGTADGVTRELGVVETAMGGRLRGQGLQLAEGIYARRSRNGFDVRDRPFAPSAGAPERPGTGQLSDTP